jgi:2-polyprenyl-3-methyl-5-hydroxy-6-metoxy-1,4-benzoquinol methylase
MRGITPSEVSTQSFSSEDTEVVECCNCAVPGLPVYDLAPFGLVRCPSCHLAFVSPRLTGDALQRLYDDPAYFEDRVYGSHGFSPSNLLPAAWTKGRLKVIEQALGRPIRGARLLEVGCGYGTFLDAARGTGMTVRGSELSATASAAARDRLGLDVHTGEVADSPTDQVDVVCAWDTIEHVPDPPAFLAAVRDRLADDGVLVFSTPSFSSLPARLFRTRWWTLKPTEHIWHFSPETHATTLARNGLALTRTIRNPLHPANLGRLDSLVGVARKVP